MAAGGPGRAKGVYRTWAHTEPGVKHLPFEQREIVEARHVREWAIQQGLKVGKRGHLPGAVIAAFNKAHRFVRFLDKNPKRRTTDVGDD